MASEPLYKVREAVERGMAAANPVVGPGGVVGHAEPTTIRLDPSARHPPDSSTHDSAVYSPASLSSRMLVQACSDLFSHDDDGDGNGNAALWDKVVSNMAAEFSLRHSSRVQRRYSSPDAMPHHYGGGSELFQRAA